MTKKVATLSPQGFIENLADKVNQTLLYFFLSDYSQTETMRGNLMPLAKLVQLYGNVPNDITSQLEETLQGYFTRNFDGATVAVTNTVTDDRINLQLSAMVQDDGVTVSVGYIITVSNSSILDIFDINNNGYVTRDRVSA